MRVLIEISNQKIPDKDLEDQRQRPSVKRKPSEHLTEPVAPGEPSSNAPSVTKGSQQPPTTNILEYGESDDEEEEPIVDQTITEEPEELGAEARALPTNPRVIYTRRRRLSTFESSDGIMDLESDIIGGSARSFDPGSSMARSATLGRGSLGRRRSFAP